MSFILRLQRARVHDKAAIYLYSIGAVLHDLLTPTAIEVDLIWMTRLSVLKV